MWLRQGYHKIHRVFILDKLIQITRNKEQEPKYSKMEINTKENGEMTKLMGKENIGPQVEISMMDIGKMTKHMEMVFLRQLME